MTKILIRDTKLMYLCVRRIITRCNFLVIYNVVKLMSMSRQKLVIKFHQLLLSVFNCLVFNLKQKLQIASTVVSFHNKPPYFFFSTNI